ncbi:MAG TPA: hypothetical protein DEF45_19780 [Rhodopirellula sp.]|nr:hypothetical protein [Rhodopirellula sp.]
MGIELSGEGKGKRRAKAGKEKLQKDHKLLCGNTLKTLLSSWQPAPVATRSPQIYTPCSESGHRRSPDAFFKGTAIASMVFSTETRSMLLLESFWNRNIEHEHIAAGPERCSTSPWQHPRCPFLRQPDP